MQTDDFVDPVGVPLVLEITRSYIPVFDMFQAASSMEHLAQQRARYTGYCGITVLVYLAFAIEAFCQTYGPTILKSTWNDSIGEDGSTARGVERLGLAAKFKLMGQTLGVPVDYGKAPWQRCKTVLRIRDEMAHPKPAIRRGKAIIVLADGEHPMDQGERLVLFERERLARDDQERKAYLEDVREAVNQLSAAMGLGRDSMFVSGGTSYTYGPE